MLNGRIEVLVNAVCRTIGLLGLAVVMPIELLAETDPEVPRKPYALFSGMDLQVKAEEGTFPIVGFSKKQIVVARNGSRDPLPSQSEITYSLRKKLSSKWVELKIRETQKYYSEANADFAAYSSAMTQGDRDRDRQVDYALGRSSNGVNSDPKVTRRTGTGDSGFDRTQAGGSTHEAISSDLEHKFQDSDSYADSLKVSLSLEVDELMKGVYLVLIARIDSPATEPDARPLIQMVGQLKPSKVRKVKAVLKNLPEGFSLLGLDVHIYSQGEEIPHHLSSGLKRLTEEEAFSYSLGKYKESGGKKDPVLFRSLRAESLSGFLSEKQILAIQADLIVHPDGSTTVDFLNTQDEPVAEKLLVMLEDVRFLPAMLDGKPTEARVSMNLSKLVD